MKLLLLLLVGSVSAFLPPPNIGYKIPENIAIPSVTFVPVETLKLYGLNETYGPDFKERPSFQELVEATQESDEIISKLPHQNVTVKEYFANFWQSFKNPRVREYIKWSTAHSLNLLFASRLTFLPLKEALSQVEQISKGKCLCPSNPRLASEFSRICSESKCEVTDEEVKRAEMVIANLTETKVFLEKIIQEYQTDGPFSKENNKQLEHLEAARNISPKFDEIYENYEYFYLREMAYLTNRTVEELLAKDKTEIELKE